MSDKLSDNPTPQEAANFFSETDAHKIARLEGYIKTYEEALSQSRKKVAALEQRVEGLSIAVSKVGEELQDHVDGHDMVDSSIEWCVDTLKKAYAEASQEESIIATLPGWMREDQT